MWFFFFSVILESENSSAKREESPSKIFSIIALQKLISFRFEPKINCSELSVGGHSCPQSFLPYPVSAVRQDTAFISFLSKWQHISRLAAHNIRRRGSMSSKDEHWRLISVNEIRWHVCTRCSLTDPVTSAVCRPAPIWDTRTNHFTSVAPKFSPLFLGFWTGSQQEAAGTTGKVTEGKRTAWVRTDGREASLVLRHQFLPYIYS